MCAVRHAGLPQYAGGTEQEEARTTDTTHGVSVTLLFVIVLD